MRSCFWPWSSIKLLFVLQLGAVLLQLLSDCATDERRDGCAEAVLDLLQLPHAHGDFLPEDKGSAVLANYAAMVQKALDVMAPVIEGLNSTTPTPSISCPKWFLANDPLRVPRWIDFLSWCPAGAMCLLHEDIPGSYSFRGIDRVQPVLSCTNSAGIEFHTVQVMKAVTGHRPMFIADIAPINMMDATAYGTKENQKSSYEDFKIQTRSVVPLLANTGVEVTSGGGIIFLGQRDATYEVFRSATHTKGVFLPWAEAGKGWKVMGVRMTDTIRARMSGMGKWVLIASNYCFRSALASSFFKATSINKASFISASAFSLQYTDRIHLQL